MSSMDTRPLTGDQAYHEAFVAMYERVRHDGEDHYVALAKAHAAGLEARERHEETR